MRNRDSQTNTLSRRQFAKQTVLTGAAFSVVPSHVLGGSKHTAPSEKLNIAGIGVGGRGGRPARRGKREHRGPL